MLREKAVFALKEKNYKIIFLFCPTNFCSNEIDFKGN